MISLEVIWEQFLIRFSNTTLVRKTPALMYVQRPFEIWTQRLSSDVLNAVTLRQLHC